jgi:hypothetical protein
VERTAGGKEDGRKENKSGGERKRSEDKNAVKGLSGRHRCPTDEGLKRVCAKKKYAVSTRIITVSLRVCGPMAMMDNDFFRVPAREKTVDKGGML